ncbi:hypothetical protein LJB42_001059 [Komagataella kurtzmanii]|nr:hypothetical protein LJB42_001059 [Komagataella kurtzmanii]
MAVKIDGKSISSELRLSIADEIKQLKQKNPGFEPRLTIIQVGDRPDSSVYVRMKLKSSEEVGIRGELLKFPTDINQEELVIQVERLNQDPSVHGILIQLPLPEHLDEPLITNKVIQSKDIDGFTNLNLASVFKKSDKPLYVPCTPKGILYLLDHEKVEISGKNVVVCGRSDIVGGPLSKLLEKRGGTVTVIHSRSTQAQKEFFCKNADILISAVGQVNFITGDIIKEGAVVIDVGTNYVPDATKKSGQRMCGDVDYASTEPKASLITPVPGGVGPMTVVMVLANVLESAKASLDSQSS